MKNLNKIILILIAIAISGCQSNSHKSTDSKIIFKDKLGNQITLKDLEGATGNYDWQIVSNKNIPKEANQLHQEARALGQNGDYNGTIKKLNKAYGIAPNWPYPVYDLAFTYMLKKDFENALKYYMLTDSIQPSGFFTAKTAVWCLRKEKEGEFKQGLYSAFVQLEWVQDEGVKLELLKNILEKYPTFAPAWKEYANRIENIDERLSAVKKGLNCYPDLETKGSLLIDEAIITNLKGDTEKAIDKLGRIIVNSETTISNKEMAKFVLASLVKQKEE